MENFECEVRIFQGGKSSWKRMPVTDRLARDPNELRRCPTCHGRVRVPGQANSTITTGWKTAREAAGLPDVLFHDLRRTGVRNLVRAGVSEHVAMSISGHRTTAVFNRYNIVSESDQQDAMLKLEAAQTTLERQAEQKLPGKIDSFMESVEDAGKKKVVEKRKTKATASEGAQKPEKKTA